MDHILQLRQALGSKVDELNTPEVLNNAERFATLEKEIAEIENSIDRAQKAEARQRSLARPVSGGDVSADAAPAADLVETVQFFSDRPAERSFSNYLPFVRSQLRSSTGLIGNSFSVDKQRHFRGFGEQLQAIANYYNSRGTVIDSRLVRAPTGAGEVDPTGGGFLVQTDFAAAIFMLAHDMGDIFSRVNTIPISANANGLKMPGIDEQSRATGSRWGGVSSNWQAEGIAGTESRPKFRMIEFDLKKLISKMTVTDEQLQDSIALGAIAGQAFSEEVMFMTEDAIFEGTGAGQPLGILNSPALVTVGKENGQASGTLVKENIDKMWARCWARSRKNAVWLINQDIEPSLAALNGTAGTGGQLVYMPPGGLSSAPYATLYGRPMVATEYSSALGAPGDIALVDLSQYTIVDKGGINFADSMHVAFDTDERRFRITYRVDGKPLWHTPLTPFKGSLAKSPFVVLAQR